MTRTFHADFGRGTSCTVTFDPARFAPGAMEHLAFKWTGQLTPAVLPKYQKWIHSVQQAIAEEIKQATMHVFLLPNGDLEAWTYEPGKPARRCM